MRLVVTGVTGFVGSNFAEYACNEGHQVVGICNSNAPRKQELRADLVARGIELFDGNILHPRSLDAAMQGADCVCHFAAAFRESGVDDEHFLELNVQGTLNVMSAAAAAKVRRVVICSTAGVYGQRVPGVTDETAKMRPWNIYERSKVEAEKAARESAAKFGIEYVILRPASVYGPRDERLLKLFKSAAKGRFPLFGTGAGRRHMVYVTDLADAFLRACVVPEAGSQELIIAGPVAVPLRIMLEELALVVGRPSCGPTLPLRPMQLLSAVVEDVAKALRINPPLYRRRMDFYLNDIAYNTKHAETVLGWRPTVDLREGLGRTFQSYCKEGAITVTPPPSTSLYGIGISALALASDYLDSLLPLLSFT